MFHDYFISVVLAINKYKIEASTLSNDLLKKAMRHTGYADHNMAFEGKNKVLGKGLNDVFY